MTFESQYNDQKKELLGDKSINEHNRDIIKTFFDKREKKLKKNKKGKQFTILDEKNYKTLCSFPHKFKNLNTWLGNTEWKPTEDFEKHFQTFFDKFTEGKILNNRGEPLKDVDFYISKIFRGKNSLFEIAGLHDIVERVLEDYTSNPETKAVWMSEKDVVAIIEQSNGIYKLLYQCAWDFGELVSALLLSKKSDYKKQYNEVTKEWEYLITFRKETLKRTRLPRTEPTRFSKTFQMLDDHLKNLKDSDYVFYRDDSKVGEDDKNKGEKIPMTLRAVEKHFDRLVEKLKIKDVKYGETPTLKHLRPSTACDLLLKSWTIEEINGRLGHELYSRVLKPYIDALALDKNKPKVREFKANIEGLNDKLSEQKNVNTLLDKRLAEQSEKQKRMAQIMMKVLKAEATEKDIEEIQEMM